MLRPALFPLGFLAPVLLSSVLAQELGTSTTAPAAASAAAAATAPADSPQAAAEAADRAQTQAALAILEAWRNGNGGDVRGERPLVIVLFTGRDTEPAPEYRARLDRVMTSVQDLYAREMARHGFGPITFPLETDEDGLVKVHVVRGAKNNAEYQKKDAGIIFEEMKASPELQGIDLTNCTLVTFCNLTVWDPVARSIRHHSPYYAIGCSTRGRAWQLDSALLDPANLADTNPEHFVHDGEYGHISLGKYNSYFVGGVAHELGHALGMPHNSQTEEQLGFWGHALMGSGNRTFGEELRGEGKGSYLTLAHALRLASHPSFTGSVKEMSRQPQSRYAEFALEKINEGRGVSVVGRVESDIPVYAVIAYADPDGGSDYDAISTAIVPDAEGRFRLDCPHFSGERGDLRLVKLHANGWASFSADLRLPWTRNSETGEINITIPPDATEPSPPREAMKAE